MREPHERQINRAPLARIPRVDETECVGCNLCTLVCPVEGCITMERRDDVNIPAETWDERVKAGQASATAVEETI